jgi:RNA polymerase sigma-70 factor (ECF subfamily)
MSLQNRLPDHVVRTDPWTLFCVDCARRMRIVTASPAEKGRETRIYKCACGHSERIDLALPPLSEPSTTTGSSTIWTTKDRANLLQPSERDAMLAAVPKLRAFAILFGRSIDRADDLVQETLLRAIAKINSFQPGTSISAWLFTILHNVFRSEYRKRCREVEDADGNCADSLKSAPEQHGRVKFEEVRVALATLPRSQREAVLLVGASGFSYEEAAAICNNAVGTIKSRVNRARVRLSELLSVDSAEGFGPDCTTRAILTAGGGA